MRVAVRQTPFTAMESPIFRPTVHLSAPTVSVAPLRHETQFLNNPYFLDDSSEHLSAPVIL